MGRAFFFTENGQEIGNLKFDKIIWHKGILTFFFADLETKIKDLIYRLGPLNQVVIVYLKE